jgi:uncharacterized membrane protein
MRRVPAISDAAAHERFVHEPRLLDSLTTSRVRPVTDRITDMGWRAAWINGGQTMATHMINKPAIHQIAWTAALLLSGLAAIHLHQETVALHRSIFRLAIRSSGVACIILIIFYSDGTSRWLLIGSLVCLIALVVYTNYALIPLNREIGTWTADAPPAGWKMRFSEMIVRERLRSFLPALAFVLELAASQR